MGNRDWVGLAATALREGANALVPGSGALMSLASQALEPEKSALRAWSADKRRHRAFANAVTSWATHRQIGEADIEDGLAAAGDILRRKGATWDVIAELNLRADRIADRVLAEDQHPQKGLSSGARSVCAEAVKQFYTRVLQDENLALDQAVERTLLARTAVIEDTVGEVRAALTSPRPVATLKRDSLAAYLTAVLNELDRDPWTREPGGPVSSVTGMGRWWSAVVRTGAAYHKGDPGAQVPVDDLVDRSARLVVLGEPGAGKSWFARRCALRCASQALAELSQGVDPAAIRIPLFGRCAVVFEASADPWRALVDAALSHVGHLLGPDVVAGLGEGLSRRDGPYLVVLDGLDEAEHLQSAGVLDRLSRVAGKDLSIVLTSRPSAWRGQLDLNDDWAGTSDCAIRGRRDGERLMVSRTGRRTGAHVHATAFVEGGGVAGRATVSLGDAFSPIGRAWVDQAVRESLHLGDGRDRRPELALVFGAEFERHEFEGVDWAESDQASPQHSGHAVVAEFDSEGLHVMLVRRAGVHRVAELGALRYPEDVHAVVETMLVDRPEVQEGLIRYLDTHPTLAHASTTPLWCTMFCLIAGRDGALPAPGPPLYQRVVTRLLQGGWRGNQHPPPGVLAAARRALRELAGAGAVEDSSGLSAWPDRVLLPSESDLSDPVLAAIAAVAPVEGYDPDAALPGRRFIHQTLREHLLVEHLAELPAEEAAARLEPHLWYDPQWDGVLAEAIAAHPQRDEVLARAIAGNEGTELPASQIRRYDGFGELQRLLAKLAVLTTPRDWTHASQAVIDAASTGLESARNGWLHAKPGEVELRRLADGDVPWCTAEAGDWVRLLDLDTSRRHALTETLITRLREPPARRDQTTPSWGDRQWGVNIAAVLDSLGPDDDQRQRAVAAATDQLTQEAHSGHAHLYVHLTADPVSATVIDAVHRQYNNVGFDDGQDHARALLLLDVLETLGADQGTLTDCCAGLITRLASAGIHEESLLRAVARHGSGEHRARAIGLLLHKSPTGSFETARHQRRIERLIPDEPGLVLHQLANSGGPWERTDVANPILAQLASRAADNDRQDAIATVTRRLEGTEVSWPLYWWSQHLQSLQPSEQQREAVVEGLLARLPQTPLSIVGNLVLPIREVGGSNEQRHRLVVALSAHLGRQDRGMTIALLDMISWFDYRPDDRTPVVTALIQSIETAPCYDTNLFWAARRINLSGPEREQLIDAYLGHFADWPSFDILLLTEQITLSSLTDTQRDRATALLLDRLTSTQSLTDARDLAEVLWLVAPNEVRQRVAGDLASMLMQADAHTVEHRRWAGLLRNMLTPAVREQVVDAVIPCLADSTIDWSDVVEFLDVLSPTGQQRQHINTLLVDATARARSYEAVNLAETALRRNPTQQQVLRLRTHLLWHLDDEQLPEEVASRLVRIARDIGLDDDDRQKAAAAIVGHRAESDDQSLRSLLELEPLDETIRKAALTCMIDHLATRVSRSRQLTTEDQDSLMQLGLDADAIAERMHRGRRVQEDPLLRSLAATLRRQQNLQAWRESLLLWSSAVT